MIVVVVVVIVVVVVVVVVVVFVVFFIISSFIQCPVADRVMTFFILPYIRLKEEQ